jgi:hypothetical protein
MDTPFVSCFFGSGVTVMKALESLSASQMDRLNESRQNVDFSNVIEKVVEVEANKKDTRSYLEQQIESSQNVAEREGYISSLKLIDAKLERDAMKSIMGLAAGAVKKVADLAKNG